MNKQPTDEMVDQMMRTLMRDAAVDENTINEITDSPTLWWGVKRQIAAKQPAAKAPWPPSKWRRILLFATPVAVAGVVIIAFFVFRPLENTGSVAINSPQPAPAINQPATAEPSGLPTGFTEAVKSESAKSTSLPTAVKPVRAIAKTSVKPALPKAVVAKVGKTTEVKSEFIALSYAGSAESGQVVRVKVPSSMMVSLGLVSSVNKSTDLVDAEVVVGDDGLTRAIRFIRQ